MDKLIEVERRIISACARGDIKLLEELEQQGAFFSQYHVLSHILSICSGRMSTASKAEDNIAYTDITQSVYKHFLKKILHNAICGTFPRYSISLITTYETACMREFVLGLIPACFALNLMESSNEVLLKLYGKTKHELLHAAECFIAKTRHALSVTV